MEDSCITVEKVFRVHFGGAVSVDWESVIAEYILYLVFVTRESIDRHHKCLINFLIII